MSALKNTFSLKRRPVSFRVNTIKSNLQEIKTELEKYKIPYSILDFPSNCFIMPDNITESDIWKLKIYKEWKIYMQSISSQVPVNYFTPKIFKSPTQEDVNSQLHILDACAAPGWKTSQLSALYPNAVIYAFEPNKIRFEKMQHNLKKLGCENVESIHDEIRNIWKYIKDNDYFDLILVDAPCSSEWSISLHNEKFLWAWDISHVRKNYKRQKHIISDIVPYLKNNWELIYSTCTLAPEENEAVVHYALCNYPELSLEKIDLSWNKYIKLHDWLKRFEKFIFKSEISENSIRVIPNEFSEWFYIAKFKKKKFVWLQ